mmetsp:Transcript_54191/g.159433  ORF Transcript_54191/g.159433 Transcript_54191/m.159433 type:complete len:303 (-) Transcript_54191:15-923(-)
MLRRRRSASPSIWVSLVVRTVSATRLLPFARAWTSPCTPLRTLCTDFSTRLATLSMFSSSLRRMFSSSCLSCLDERSSMRDCMPRDISDASSTVLEERPIFCPMFSRVAIMLSPKSACWRSCWAWLISNFACRVLAKVSELASDCFCIIWLTFCSMPDSPSAMLRCWDARRPSILPTRERPSMSIDCSLRSDICWNICSLPALCCWNSVSCSNLKFMLPSSSDWRRSSAWPMPSCCCWSWLIMLAICDIWAWTSRRIAGSPPPPPMGVAAPPAMSICWMRLLMSSSGTCPGCPSSLRGVCSR